MQQPDDEPARLLQGPPGLTQTTPLYLETPPRRRSAGMRRRMIVFFSVFVLCAIVSLAYSFMRPAVYLASARLQVMPQAKLPKGETVAAAVARLKKRIGITRTLKDCGIRSEDIPQLARIAVKDPCMATNPVPPTIKDIETIYAQAL